jgi:hypothetical protein
VYTIPVTYEEEMVDKTQGRRRKETPYTNTEVV